VEKEDLIINLLKETRADQKEANEDIAEIKTEVALNRIGLDEHMAQTKAVKELIIKVEEAHDSRLQKVENHLTITHLLKLVVTTAGGIGVISGAIYGVIRLFQNG